MTEHAYDTCQQQVYAVMLCWSAIFGRPVSNNGAGDVGEMTYTAQISVGIQTFILTV